MEHHHEKTSHVKAHVHRHESMQDGHPHEHHARATAEGMDQGGHDKHAGHSPEMFRNRFVVSLVLTLPILYYEHLFPGPHQDHIALAQLRNRHVLSAAVGDPMRNRRYQ